MQRRKLPRQRYRIVRLALPNGQDSEAERLQRGFLGCIATTVVGKLLGPKGSIAGRDSGSLATSMMMPKTTIDEKRPFSRLIGKVRAAGQLARGASVSDAECSQDFRHQLFRRRSNASDAFHQRASDRIRFQSRTWQIYSAGVAAARSRSRILSRWRPTRSRNPSTNRKVPISVRFRNPAVARIDNKSAWNFKN